MTNNFLPSGIKQKEKYIVSLFLGAVAALS